MHTSIKVNDSFQTIINKKKPKSSSLYKKVAAKLNVQLLNIFYVLLFILVIGTPPT